MLMMETGFLTPADFEYSVAARMFLSELRGHFTSVRGNALYQVPESGIKDRLEHLVDQLDTTNDPQEKENIFDEFDEKSSTLCLMYLTVFDKYLCKFFEINTLHDLNFNTILPPFQALFCTSPLAFIQCIHEQYFGPHLNDPIDKGFLHVVVRQFYSAMIDKLLEQEEANGCLLSPESCVELLEMVKREETHYWDLVRHYNIYKNHYYHT